MTRAELMAKWMAKYGPVVDLRKHPEVVDDVIAMAFGPHPTNQGLPTASTTGPFGTSWMDSWVAHWVYNENVKGLEARRPEVAEILRNLADLKFDQRLREIRTSIARWRGLAEPPDGGTPEPGVPNPPGPSSFTKAPTGWSQTPDGGPPEPGVPPAGPASFGTLDPRGFIGRTFAAEVPPDAGPPEPGVPDPPDPPEPPEPPEPGPGPGPATFVRENPWILYWFLSVKTPLLLEVIDLHLTRRLQEVGRQLSQQKRA